MASKRATKRSSRRSSRKGARRHGNAAATGQRALIARFPVTRLHLNNGGYTSSGQYYGQGVPLFEVWDEQDGLVGVVRAQSAAEAREKAIAGWMRTQNWSGQYGRKVWSPTTVTIKEDYNYNSRQYGGPGPFLHR